MARLLANLQSEFLRAFFGTMAISIWARLAQLGMTVLLARELAPEGYGLFTFALGLGLVGGRVGALGWPVLMLRFIPVYLSEERWGMLKGLLRTANWVVLTAGCIFGCLVVTGGVWLGPQHELYSGFLLGGLLLPVMSLRSLARNTLAGYKNPAKGIFIDELLPPLLVCLVLITPFVASAVEAALFYLAASAAAVAVGAWLLANLEHPKTASAKAERHLRLWMAIALPALVGMSAKLLMNKTDVIMIAPLSNLEEVGLYGAALRITYLQTFPVVVLSTVLSPLFSTAFSQNQFGRLRKLFLGALLIAGVFSGIVAIPVILAREPIMTTLFGADYAAGAPVIAVLALAQTTASLGFITTSLLLMSGRQNVFGTLTLIALSVNVLGNFALIPQYGAFGGAISTMLATGLLFVCQLWVCIKTMRELRSSKDVGSDA